ncbi:MAG TPA: DUF4135 domain-containing protein, partial [Blastocatellia bacterium]|nr:DUF4135 domain-containing protein [Blastocatellia bacterium]
MNSATEIKPTTSLSWRDRLCSVIARGAPPSERAEGVFFRPVAARNPDRIEKLVSKWRDTVIADGRQISRSRLAALGISEETVRAGFADVALRNPDVLPDWGDAFLEVIGAGRGESEDITEAAGGSLRHIDVPNLDLIAALLAGPDRFVRSLAATLTLRVSPASLDQILSVFARRLVQLVSPVLEFEIRLAKANEGLLNKLGTQSGRSLDSSAAGWLSRIERFPVLAYLIGASYLGFRTWIGEICDRLQEDRQMLAEELFGGLPLREWTGFQGDAGDVHGGGRTVAILSFDQNRKVVYKPKDLRCAEAFLDLVAALNQSELDPPLHL